MSTTQVPAIEGWFTTDAEPCLLGTRCTTCGTVFFPAATGFCRNPRCRGRDLEPTALSRTGTVWSYTDAQYQPPPPYIPPGDEHAPFARSEEHTSELQSLMHTSYAVFCCKKKIDTSHTSKHTTQHHHS